MKITIVRHGQTDFNFENKIQGSTNNYLNDEGRRQCKILRDKLSDKHFDYCYMSPLLRTVETAMILIGERVETVPDKRLIERGMGNFEGKCRDEYDSKKYWNYALNSGDDGVEKVQDIFERCTDFLNYLYERHPNQSILIVSHGSPIRAFHHILSNSDLYGNLLDVEINNCYCEEFEVEGK